MFSQEGSRNHANLTHLQEKERAKKMIAISGRRCFEQYEKLNPDGSLAKTFMALLIGTGEWYSMRCNLTWKLKGTKYGRLYFQLRPSMHRTEGTEFGLLLKTPSAMDAYAENLKKDAPVSGNSGTLAQEIMNGFAEKRGFLPTINATDTPAKNTGTRNQGSIPKMIRDAGGQASQLNPRFVAEMMGFPTDWTELPFQNGETKV